jgi:hypothetical protein
LLQITPEIAAKVDAPETSSGDQKFGAFQSSIQLRDSSLSLGLAKVSQFSVLHSDKASTGTQTSLHCENCSQTLKDY